MCPCLSSITVHLYFFCVTALELLRHYAAVNLITSLPHLSKTTVSVCMCVSSLLLYPHPPSSPIQSLISSFIGKRWDESFIFSLVMLFCYYTAVGLGEMAKNIIVVIFRDLTLFDIFLEMYECALKSVFMVHRTHSLNQKVIVAN